MRTIKNIVIHCSAGHTDAAAIQRYFLRPKNQGGRGWHTGGYHIIIEKDGTLVQMYPFDKVTNGVRGHNLSTIHICYVGGVDPKNVRKAKDTRTAAQKKAIPRAVQLAKDWICTNGQDTDKGLGVVGHRDYSPDKNHSGLIEPYERIKECPSFDVMKEYSKLLASKDRYLKLP